MRAAHTPKHPDLLSQYLPQSQDCLFGLEWLVVGELDHVRDRSE